MVNGGVTGARGMRDDAEQVEVVPHAVARQQEGPRVVELEGHDRLGIGKTKNEYLNHLLILPFNKGIYSVR